jgi:hypothetical protein
MIREETPLKTPTRSHNGFQFGFLESVPDVVAKLKEPSSKRMSVALSKF